MSNSCLPAHSLPPAPSHAAVDASCRAPLAVLFSGAALWLLVAAVAALLASMSFHKPDLFADSMRLSFGRILPFAKTALLYGFCLPSAYGLALWLAARLARAPLACSMASAVGAVLLHLAVFVGAFGILCGASSGFEGFELPGYAAWMLFVASLLLGFVGLLTIHQRREPAMYPSLWFLIAALLWFPWILSTAILLLGVSPVRGVAQSAVAAWYLNNLQSVVLVLFGMAAGLYFMPKLARRPLFSKYLALFSLLTLLLFGGWGGLGVGGPFPVWMGAISSVATALALIPALAHMDNVRRSCCIRAPEPEARFFSFAVPFLVLAFALAAVGAFAAQTHFTLFRPGQVSLLLQGFFALLALGGVYHVLPRILDRPWPFGRLVRLHLWLAVAGVLMTALPYLVGGWLQGARLNQPVIPFVEVAKSTLMPIRMATVGELLWAAGALLLVLNVAALAFGALRACWTSFLARNTSVLPSSEVKA